MTVQVPGALSPTRLDGVLFVERLRRQLSGPNLLPRIPMLIRELHHGDSARAAELLMTGGDSESGPGSYGVTLMDLKVEGTNVTGTISQARATVNVFDGRIAENELIFKATSGDGIRTITLVGKLH